MKSVLVICRGNIARSPVAEYYLKREIDKNSLNNEIYVFSRGTQGTSMDPQPVKFPNISYYPDLYRDAKPALDKLNINITKHISKMISSEDVTKADIVLVVDKKTKSAVETLFPEFRDKIHNLSELSDRDEDLPDPENISGTDKHLKIFRDIKNTIQIGFPNLLKLLRL